MSEPTWGFSGQLVTQKSSSTVMNTCSLGRSTSTLTPNILSTEYDPFAPIPSSSSSVSTHDIYSTPSSELEVFSASPDPSDSVSQRSSFSSVSRTGVYEQAGGSHSYIPRIKMEDHLGYPTSTEAMMLSSSQLNHGLLATSSDIFPDTLDGDFYEGQAQMGWSKAEYLDDQELPSICSLSIPQHNRRSESLDRLSSDHHGRRRSSSTMARTRQPRKLTTKEEANFQCHVEGCGKFFSRSYNFKAHLDTHDATREYPFPCLLKGCNKRFVRKTDLQRHHQSVHMKQRDYRCDYCSRFFARKDTLRRHMEDGCSKRFDIETVDFRPQTYSELEQAPIGSNHQTLDYQSRHPSYSSSQYTTPPTTSIGSSEQHSRLTSAPAPYFGSQGYPLGNDNQGSLWPH